MKLRGKFILCSVTIFGKVSLLALVFMIAAVVKFDMLKGVDLLNAAVIQNSSCMRPSVCCKVLYTLVNLAAEFRAGALLENSMTHCESNSATQKLNGTSAIHQHQSTTTN